MLTNRRNHRLGAFLTRVSRVGERGESDRERHTARRPYILCMTILNHNIKFVGDVTLKRENDEPLADAAPIGESHPQHVAN